MRLASSCISPLTQGHPTCMHLSATPPCYRQQQATCTAPCIKKHAAHCCATHRHLHGSHAPRELVLRPANTGSPHVHAPVSNPSLLPTKTSSLHSHMRTHETLCTLLCNPTAHPLRRGAHPCLLPPLASPPAAAAPAAAAPAAKPAAPASPGGIEISSPMSGTFYATAAPGEPPFVKVGDRVKKGQTIGIIEAMKLMNEIEVSAALRWGRISIALGILYGSASLRR
jgi:biotin carboxyl carrier protein